MILGLKIYTLSFSKLLPFKAEFIPPGDHNFSVFPSSGELLPESEDGTLIRVFFNKNLTHKNYNFN